MTLGIRPEHMRLGETGWPAVVSVVEPTGSETQITARIRDQVIRILVTGRTDAGPGDHIYLQTETRHLHFFDTGTGRRL